MSRYSKLCFSTKKGPVPFCKPKNTVLFYGKWFPNRIWNNFSKFIPDFGDFLL